MERKTKEEILKSKIFIVEDLPNYDRVILYEDALEEMQFFANQEKEIEACEFLRSYRAYLKESRNYRDDRTEEELYAIYQQQKQK